MDVNNIIDRELTFTCLKLNELISNRVNDVVNFCLLSKIPKGTGLRLILICE